MVDGGDGLWEDGMGRKRMERERDGVLDLGGWFFRQVLVGDCSGKEINSRKPGETARYDDMEAETGRWKMGCQEELGSVRFILLY